MPNTPTKKGEQKVLVVPDGKICDYIDGKFRNDTPEEYVRQTIEKRLVNEHKYDPSQIKVEYTLQMGSSKPRADLVIWDKDAEKQEQGNIRIIIECKKDSVPARSAKDGIGQLKSYMAACPNCEWGMWTNSLEKFVFRKVRNEAGEFKYEERNDIPSADGNVEATDRPEHKSLRNASDDNLLFVFRTCHNYIYANDGMQKQDAFFEFLKVIFCKIEDEHDYLAPVEFYATAKEKNNPDGQLTVKKRITKIFDRVKQDHREIFDDKEELNLTPRSLAHVVSELQNYTLLGTHIDIKGKAYEEIVGANLRGDRGEFFTPRNVMKMAVEMIDPREEERVLDSSCGTGGFIVLAMTHVLDNLAAGFENGIGLSPEKWNMEQTMAFGSRREKVLAHNYYGFDINPALAKATKMNMFMNNDGSGNILQVNSLLPPHEWPDDFKRRLADGLKIDKGEIRNHKTIGFFDVILTNPPFGSKIPIRDGAILGQFELARIWKRQGNTWFMTDRYQASVPPEILFIERCTQFLKEGGRMGIVLPNSILNAPGLGYVRQWIIQNHRIVASVELSADTFQPHNGTLTSVLFLQKKTQAQKDNEEKTGLMADYNIFMATVEKIGHDRRGNPLFLRDKEGNEILDAEGQKILDDQTKSVAALFSAWKRQEGISW